MSSTVALKNAFEVEFQSAQEAQEFEQWDRYVESSCTPDTYYRPQYVTAYSGNPDERMVAVVVPTATNRFLLPLTVRPVEISAQGEFDAITPYGYGGVLPLDNRGVDAADARELMLKLRGFCRERNIVSLLLRLHPQLLQNEWLEAIQDEDTALVCHGQTAGIDCSQWDGRIDAPVGLAKGRRSDLSVARRALTVQRLEGGTEACEAGLETFRTIYELTMSRIGASAFYMFEKNYYALLSRGLSREMCVINALQGNVVVGSAIFFAGREFAHYHLSGATDEGRQCKAGTLILIEAARWARERDCRSLHLGGGTHADDSLFRFKQSFGGPIYDYHFLTIIADRLRYDAATNARNNCLSLPPARAGFFPKYRA